MRIPRPSARRFLGPAQMAGLSFALCVGCSCDDGGTPVDSTSAKKDPVDENDPQQDMAEMLRLEEREFPLTIWAAHIIQEDYYDKGRFNSKRQLDSALDELGLHTPEFFGTRQGNALKVTVKSNEQTFDITKVDDLRSASNVLEQVMSFAAKILSLDGEAKHELEYAGINGFLAPLDPHTVLLTPDQTADLGVKTKGQFAGIGAEVRPENRRLVVVRVLPDSPAERAGLKAGDVMLEIDGQSTVNVDLGGAQKLLRGPVDTKVVIKVKRDGESLTIEITRGVIRIASVRTTTLPGSVGYMQITTFQEDTAQKVQESLEGMKNSGVAAVIIDLRGNSGGLLMQAAHLLDQMTTEGELVIVHSAEGRESEAATPKLILEEKIPVVAMVDEGTASAAEIVSGAVKHLGRGVVIGRASFGKGTVQMLRDAAPYGRKLALKMTVAEYRVAGDRQIQSVGVRPDLRIEPVRLSNFPGVANFYDRERFDREREIHQTRHLPSAIHDEGADAFVISSKRRLRYLDDMNIGDIVVEDPEVARAMADAEIRVARRVGLALAEVGNVHSERDGVLESLLTTLQVEEDRKIAKAIAGWDIVWSETPPADTAASSLLATASILERGPFLAGQPFTLRVEVKNGGREAVDRVHVITDCDQQELDGIELLFGRLEPGASAFREVQLQMMPWHADSTDILRIEAHVGEPDDAPDARGEVRFSTRAAIRPTFSYDYWIVDDPELIKRAPKRPPAELMPGERPFEVRGNGDGLLQAGEKVLFAFRMHNAGPGEAPDVKAVLRNLSGAQGLLEEGAVPGGRLATGQALEGAFGIAMAPNADPSLPLELEFIAGDGLLRESIRKKIRLKVLPGRADFVAKKSKATVGDDGARLYAGADSSTQVVASLEAGTALAIVGEAGDWLAIDHGRRGRRLWLPKEATTAGNQGSAWKGGTDHAMVDPPTIEVAATDIATSADSITVRGVARHAARTRDVVVRVRRGGHGGRDKKVFYLANPEHEGEAARQLEFEASVPLEPGNNRISIIARDGDRVERRRDLWIRRQ